MRVPTFQVALLYKSNNANVSEATSPGDIIQFTCRNSPAGNLYANRIASRNMRPLTECVFVAWIMHPSMRARATSTGRGGCRIIICVARASLVAFNWRKCGGGGDAESAAIASRGGSRSLTSSAMYAQHKQPTNAPGGILNALIATSRRHKLGKWKTTSGNNLKWRKVGQVKRASGRIESVCNRIKFHFHIERTQNCSLHGFC